MAQPLIAAIVVNWNRRELLLEAVRSLLASEGVNLRVIVVDNGSRDGSVDAVRSLAPEMTVIPEPENTGFAAGNNRGITAALDSGAEFLFFLNNDAVVEPGTLAQLHSFLQANPEAGGVAPFIFYHDNPDAIWFGGGDVKLWRGRVAHRYIRRRFHPDRHRPRRSDYLTGCALLVRSQALRQVGGFDERFTMYSEDVDLSLRLRRAGWSLWVSPRAVARHRVSVSAGGELSPFKAYHRARSMTLLVKRHLRWWEAPTLAVGGLIAGVLVSATLLARGKVATVPALWYGVIGGFLGLQPPPRFQLPK